MSELEFQKGKAEARKRVQRLDKIDNKRPRDPKTILAALECGIKRPETNAHFDAFVMLEDAAKEGWR